MSNVLRVGDILEVTLPAGVAYVSYAGKSEELGDAIWVVPEVLPEPTRDWSTVFSNTGYFAFYPAHAALRNKLIRRVGHALEAMRLVPTRQRSPVQDEEQGVVTSWLITEGNAWTRRRAAEMSPSDWELPRATIWNHAYLVQAIATGIRP